ncbi:MAG: alpha-galactosidase [Chloroflexi bacterium]|nr:alpha-galactosidase [Chloroflexota bacterium]
MKQFADVVIQEKPELTISYRSGLMVYEEGLRDGKWVALSYSASGHMMSANTRPTPPYMDINQFAQPQSFRLNLDGQDLCSHWRCQSVEVERTGEGVKAVVTLVHEVRSVLVRVVTALHGNAVFERYIEVENTSASPSALAMLSPLSGGYQIMTKERNDYKDQSNLYRLGYMKETLWGHEGAFCWKNLSEDSVSVSGRFRRERYRHPIFVLENLVSGETLLGQLAWTGGYTFAFDLNRENARVAAMSMDIALDAPAPLLVLAPGERYKSPSVHIALVFGGLDAAVQEMHRHIRQNVFLPPTRGVTGWVESGIGPEFEMDRDSTLASLEHAHSLGVELFFIDAGWYLPPNTEDEWWNYCGDWRYNKDRYPNGLQEIRDAVKEKGMLFGMWMDAERIGPKSQVWAEHEEWRAMNYNGRRTPSGLLNLADPKLAAWMEDQIRYLLDEYQLDMFRLDHNVGAQDAVAFNQRDGYLENTFARYYDNVYSMYDRLRAEYPNVVFENCAGGGGRTDLGMTSHFTHTWVTDWQIHPRAFSITNGMTMALPPENVDRLIGGQSAYLTADITTLIRNLIFARPTVGCFTPAFVKPNPIQHEIVRHHIDLYKRFVRPMHRESLMFHHTPDLSQVKDGFGVLEIAHEDVSRGMVGVFKISEAGKDETIVYPRGIAAGRDYVVTLDNTGESMTVSGGALLRHGLRIRLSGALTSELILLQATADAAE